MTKEGLGDAMKRLMLSCALLCAVSITVLGQGARQIAVTMGNNLDLLESDVSLVKSTQKKIITGATTISEPGSYILAHDIEGQITITASDVYLDLNGHTITSNMKPYNCIVIRDVERNVTIRNGFLISGCACYNGVDKPENCGGIKMAMYTALDYVQGFVFEDLTISVCTGRGILLQAGSISNCLIKNCKIIGDSMRYSTGITLATDGAGVIIDHCEISGVQRGIRFRGGGGANFSVVQNCTIMNCMLWAIIIDENSGSGNIIRNNTIRNCGYGIRASSLVKAFIYQNDVQGCQYTGVNIYDEFNSGVNRAIHCASSLYVYGNFAKNNNGGTAYNYSSEILLKTTSPSTTTGLYANASL